MFWVCPEILDATPLHPEERGIFGRNSIAWEDLSLCARDEAKGEGNSMNERLLRTSQ